MEVEWKESSQKTIHMVGHKGKVKTPARMYVVYRTETSVSVCHCRWNSSVLMPALEATTIPTTFLSLVIHST